MASGDKKKLVVAIGLFVVAAAIFAIWMRPSEPLSNTVRFVDVSTGKSYQISRNNIPSIFPVPNPDSGTRTLLPIEERDGKTYILARYRDFLAQVEKENRYVDAKTLEVRPPQ
jgi:hypothetical protein